MSICHVKFKKTSSFKPVTRKQPFLCKSGRPDREAYLYVFEDEPETATTEEVTARLKRIDPSRTLCADCAEKLNQ